MSETQETTGEPSSDRPAKKTKKSYLVDLLEGRRKAGAGAQYYYTALKHSVPMVFCRYDGRHIAGIISKDGGTRFTLATKKGRLVVDKIDLQFSYRARSHGEINRAIRIDERVKKMKLPPIKEPSARYQIPDEALQECQESGSRLRLNLRGGEVLEGRVEWFGGYDIKLELATGRSVVVFRHAVYSHALLTERGVKS